MLVVGLTGSIGMGKSTAAARFRSHGIGVLDADRVVHELYSGPAVPLVEAAFPGTAVDGVIDRQRLAAALAATRDGFKRLETIVHPLVRETERAFLAAEHARGAGMAVLEIPLLFETGAHRQVDVVVVVSAPAKAQRERVLARPGMTADRLDQLLGRQLADAEKRKRADFVVDTGGDIEASEAQVDAIVALLAGRDGTAYQRYWIGA